MTANAELLAGWTQQLEPSGEDAVLARQSLIDTCAVMLAAAADPMLDRARPLGEAGLWAVAAHLLDFDDLHLPSTAHISAVITPVVLACGGDARAYLAGAGVMARIGIALGWKHYTAGWHATCTSGALGAAAAAAVSFGLDEAQTAHAIALAVPAAGGVQRAFGTDAKSLQVGFAADAGVRAAALAANGIGADLLAVEDWFGLVAPDSSPLALEGDMSGPAIPGGLAVKLHPCCYAMQRPIGAVRQLRAAHGDRLDPSRIASLRARTPQGTLTPLIHHRPTTGLQGKFSLEYALATALLDDFPTAEHFTDAAVNRPLAHALMGLVDTTDIAGGSGLLDGAFELTIGLTDGSSVQTSVTVPPGAPHLPPTEAEMGAKVQGCLAGTGIDPSTLADLSFAEATEMIRERIGRDRAARPTGLLPSGAIA